MNYKLLGKFLGLVLLIEAGLLIFPLIVALIYRESIAPYLITIGILLAVSLPTRFIRPKNKRFYAKDGFVCVALSWILLSAFGALPFVIGGSIPNYIDAFFETVSGFTTTGATIIHVGGIEALPKSVLFWRSFSHWVGGMGILVFMLAITPTTEGNIIFLMRAEVPGPQKGKLVPKLRDSSMILYIIYLVLTLAQTAALLCTGMPFFDCLVNSFGTMGTGGFSVLNDSIAGYNNPAAEIIIAVFLIIAGTNYNVFFYLFIKKFSEVKKNEELRLYSLTVLTSTVIISLNIFRNLRTVYSTFGHALRDSFFQVSSIISTAGFTTADFASWPYLSQTIIFILMFTGACAGSTAGGFKLSRILIIFKAMGREVRKIFKPNSVKTLHLDGNTLDEMTVSSAMNYLCFYAVTIIASIFIIALDGKDLLTTVSSVITCFNNVGPGFGEAYLTFAGFSYFSKIIFSFIMLFGRLEIFPMLILLSPTTWKKN